MQQQLTSASYASQLHILYCNFSFFSSASDTTFQSRDFHERGKRHQENVQKKLDEVMSGCLSVVIFVIVHMLAAMVLAVFNAVLSVCLLHYVDLCLVTAMGHRPLVFIQVKVKVNMDLYGASS